MRKADNAWTARGPVLLGFAALVLLLAGVGYWASFSTLSGAVVVHGRVEVERNRQIVQHVDGGTGDDVLVDGIEQVILADAPATGGVDKKRRRLHLRKMLGPYHVPRFGS